MKPQRRALRALISRIRELDARGRLEPGTRQEVVKHVISLWRAVRRNDRRRAELAIDKLVRVFLNAMADDGRPRKPKATA
jgi:hypothetical protein